jgi:hypothetical protein
VEFIVDEEWIRNNFDLEGLMSDQSEVIDLDLEEAIFNIEKALNLPEFSKTKLKIIGHILLVK